MEINLGLVLPRDEMSVPVARHICRHALEEIGVDPACVSDVELALAEASTNVLLHSGPGDEYEIHLSIDGPCCVIRVVDSGFGFDDGAPHLGQSDPSAEGGRGIQLMRGLVDRVRFESQPEVGTVVHLEKELSFLPGWPLKRPRRRSGSRVSRT